MVLLLPGLLEVFAESAVVDNPDSPGGNTSSNRAASGQGSYKLNTAKNIVPGEIAGTCQMKAPHNLTSSVS